MNMRMAMPKVKPVIKRASSWHLEHLDPMLLFVCIALLSLGVVMVASASVGVADRNFSNPFYYLQRQLVFVVIGVMAAAMVYRIRLVQWEK